MLTFAEEIMSAEKCEKLKFWTESLFWRYMIRRPELYYGIFQVLCSTVGGIL